MPHKSLAKVRTARSKKTTDVFRRAQAYLQAGAAFEKAGKMPQAKAAYKKAQELFKRAARSGMLFGPVGRLPNSRGPSCPNCNASGKRLRGVYGTVTHGAGGSGVVSGAFKCLDCKTSFGWHRTKGYANIQAPKDKRNPSPPLTEWDFDDSDIEAAMKLGARQAMEDRKSARERAREHKAAAEREQKAWQVSFYSKKHRKRLAVPFALYAETKAAAISEGKARQSGDPKDRVNWTAVRVNPMKQRSNPRQSKVTRKGSGYQHYSVAYGVAVAHGYPYIRGEGKTARNNYTWLSRFTKTADGTGPALFVGWDEKAKDWIIEGAKKRNPGLIDLAANLQAAQSVKDLIAPGKRRKRNARTVAQTSWNIRLWTERAAAKLAEGFTKKQTLMWLKEVGLSHRDASLILRGLKRPRRNPSIKATSQLFQGAASGKVSELKAANSAPSDLARIGKLVFIKLAGARAQTRIPGAMVAVDKNGKLWLCGSRAPMFRQKAKPGEALDYGYIDQVCYFTTKRHLDNAPTEYVHSFGEEGGKRPRLLVDHEGMPILRGGDYKITADGIVN